MEVSVNVTEPKARVPSNYVNNYGAASLRAFEQEQLVETLA